MSNAVAHDQYAALPPSPAPPNSSSADEDEEVPFRAQRNPLASASLASVVLTHWMQPLVTLGACKVLDKEDIWPLCPQDTCDALQLRFAVHYQAPRAATAGHNQGVFSQVALAFLKTFKREIAVVFANYTVYILAMAMQSYIAQAILDFLNDRENVFHAKSGYVLVAMMTSVSAIAVTCLNYGFFVSSRVGVNMRSVMMDVVYQKSLRLSCVGRQTYTTGEIVTLMSVDAERVFNGMLNGPWLLVAPLAFVVTIVLITLLFDFLSALCGACLLAAVLYVSVRLAERIGQLQKELLKVVDERVKVTSEALQGIRVMKFYAWEASLARRVEAIRAQEVQLYRQFHHYQILNTTLLFLTPVLLGGITLGFYVIVRGNLSVTDAFTLIAIVNISRLAVNMFPLGIAAASQAQIAYSRVDAYLKSDELTAFASVGAEAAPRGSISVRDAHLQWSRQQQCVDAVRPEVVIVSESADKREESGGESFVTPGAFTLEGVNIEIDAGELVMIVGTVGAGKSSLLNAILGEMKIAEGVMEVNGEISYVSQEAWIRNSTVQDNILFEAPFDVERYQQVLEAAQLAMDLYALPNGDQTEIGERGINLSGGQKARVAIARAMYRSQYDILILDDPLSAVDPHVAHAIFDQCVVGLAKSKTRLLVLNSHYDLLKHADKVLVVRDGRIVGDGTYEQMMAQFPELRMQSETLDKLERDVIDEHDDTDVEEKQQHELAVAMTAASAARTIAEQSAWRLKATKNAKMAEPTADGVDDPNKLVQAEDRIKGKVAADIYKNYFDEAGFNGYLVLLMLLLMYTVSQGMRTLVDWWQGHWARNMKRDGIDPTFSNLKFGMWYLGFIVVCCILTFARGLFMVEACIRSSKNLHNELFRRVLGAPVNTYF
ncbi:Abc transporter c family member 2, partial [Globisporangium polare]